MKTSSLVLKFCAAVSLATLAASPSFAQNASGASTSAATKLALPPPVYGVQLPLGPYRPALVDYVLKHQGAASSTASALQPAQASTCSSPVSPVVCGIFIDDLVENLDYYRPSAGADALTGSDGKFEAIPGEPVSFYTSSSTAGAFLGQATLLVGNQIVTPFDLALATTLPLGSGTPAYEQLATPSLNSDTAINIARALQAIGTSSSGVLTLNTTLAADLGSAASAGDLTFDETAANFNSQWTALQSTYPLPNLPTATAAISQIQTNLTDNFPSGSTETFTGTSPANEWDDVVVYTGCSPVETAAYTTTFNVSSFTVSGTAVDGHTCATSSISKTVSYSTASTGWQACLKATHNGKCSAPSLNDQYTGDIADSSVTEENVTYTPNTGALTLLAYYPNSGEIPQSVEHRSLRRLYIPFYQASANETTTWTGVGNAPFCSPPTTDNFTVTFADAATGFTVDGTLTDPTTCVQSSYSNTYAYGTVVAHALYFAPCVGSSTGGGTYSDPAYSCAYVELNVGYTSGGTPYSYQYQMSDQSNVYTGTLALISYYTSGTYSGQPAYTANLTCTAVSGTPSTPCPSP